MEGILIKTFFGLFAIRLRRSSSKAILEFIKGMSVPSIARLDSTYVVHADIKIPGANKINISFFHKKLIVLEAILRNRNTKMIKVANGVNQVDNLNNK